VTSRLRRAGEFTLASCSTSLLAALAFWFFEARARYFSVFFWTGEAPSAVERWLVGWAACAALLTLLLLGSLVGAGLAALGRPRFASLLWVVWAGLSLTFAAVDLRVYQTFARHLRELWRFAFVAGAADVAGGAAPYVRFILASLLIAFAGCGVLLWAFRCAFQRGFAGTRLSHLAAVALAAWLALGAVAWAPRFTAEFFVHKSVLEAICGTLPWDPRPEAADLGDPGWTALKSGLRRAYARSFPFIFAEHSPRVPAPSTPHVDRVVLIVLESWRADALTSERMPRLYAWSQQGLVAHRHYAGTNYSEAGMFALIYGRSPLLFHATLDQHEPPALCRIARTFGLSCQYFSGQPHPWLRMEEFLSERTLDRFVHDANGDWNDWDRTALRNMADSVGSATPPRSLSVVYLMSTHFEYVYPKAYERHLPIVEIAHQTSGMPSAHRATPMPAMGVNDRQPLINRYLNSLAFTDDAVADALARLDLKSTLVIVTGDHAELLGEEGHVGHGFGFPEPMTHVPFVMVGPGITPSVREEPSEHADLLLSVEHVLSGKAQLTADGRDLFASPPRENLLFAHCGFGRDEADVLLVHGSRRLRLTLGLRKPVVTSFNFEDDLGRRLPLSSLSPGTAAELVAAFDEELAALRNVH